MHCSQAQQCSGVTPQVPSQVAEKALQTYERDGWSEFNTQIVPERREIRPTADRGPILLCVDTSGSMRGPREVVAKALALECMRAARAQAWSYLSCCQSKSFVSWRNPTTRSWLADCGKHIESSCVVVSGLKPLTLLQERGCFVFAFAGPQEVRELELGTDMASVNNLLGFLEKVGSSETNARHHTLACAFWMDAISLRGEDTDVPAICQVFNGGSDFNEPVRRCLDRLHTAAWANSDILLVSDGELRQPGVEIMRKLAGLLCAL